MSASRTIARWLTRPPPLPASVREEAAEAFVDTLGCALAGWSEPSVQTLIRSREPLPSSPDAGAFTWGDGRETTPGLAALINGTAAHALDYDDLVLEVTAHPSGALVAAALAAGEAARASGREVLSAYVRGLELLVRLGETLGFRHYELGWHATSTLGTLGAVGTAGSLRGLDEEEMVHALGTAASMASGLQKNFGSMVKPLHMGMAARHGVRAARLAAKGFEADGNVFGEGGFGRAFTGGAVDAVDVSLGEPLYLEESGLSRKKYPCCYATHRMIEGALRLREGGLTDPGKIESLTVTVPPGGLAPLRDEAPETGSEAKFSGEYCVLTALRDGTVNLESFTEEAVRRETIRTFLSRVLLREEDGEPPPDATLADGIVTMECELVDGGTLTRTVEDVPGSPRDPMTPEELHGKFRDCRAVFARRTGRSVGASGKVFQRWMQLEDLEELREGLRDLTSDGPGVSSAD